MISGLRSKVQFERTVCYCITVCDLAEPSSLVSFKFSLTFLMSAWLCGFKVVATDSGNSRLNETPPVLDQIPYKPQHTVMANNTPYTKFCRFCYACFNLLYLLYKFQSTSTTHPTLKLATQLKPELLLETAAGRWMRFWTSTGNWGDSVLSQGQHGGPSAGGLVVGCQPHIEHTLKCPWTLRTVGLCRAASATGVWVGVNVTCVCEEILVVTRTGPQRIHKRCLVFQENTM